MIRPLLAMALLGSAALAPAIAAAPPAADGPTRIFSGQDLFGLEMASDPQISPDGRTIAYVRRSNDIMTDRARSTIWLVDTATGAQQPLVAGPGTHGSPRWSPDGTRLAFVSTDGAGAPQLSVRWMASGATARVTGLPDSPSDIVWSPDGTQIAYVMAVPGEATHIGDTPHKPEGATWAAPLEVIDRVTYRADGEGYVKPGYDHIFVVPADGGAPRQLTFGAVYDNGPLSWSHDGRTLLFGAVRTPDWQLQPVNSEIYTLDVASGALAALTHRQGPDQAPAMSPDGTHIAYLGYDDTHRAYENTQLYVMNRDGSGARSLTATLDRTIDAMRWSADGRSLVASYADHGATKVARIGLDGNVSPIADTRRRRADRPAV